MHSCSASSGKPDSNSLDCIVFSCFVVYLHVSVICRCRCLCGNHYILTALIFAIVDALFQSNVSATCFSLNLQMLFSPPVMLNCIYILPFLVLEDTSFTNFASTSHIFYDLRMLLIEIMHLQFPKIHYRRYRRSISFKFYLVHDNLQARKDYALLRELRRASPTPIRRSA